jgi:hypothetical protein
MDQLSDMMEKVTIQTTWTQTRINLNETDYIEGSVSNPFKSNWLVVWNIIRGLQFQITEMSRASKVHLLRILNVSTSEVSRELSIEEMLILFDIYTSKVDIIDMRESIPVVASFGMYEPNLFVIIDANTNWYICQPSHFSISI